MKEFEKFVSSPYFNGGRNYIPFFSLLKKFYPAFDDEKLTPEYIYSGLYPEKEFNKQIIWNMSSSMLNMAEEFLINISLKKNKFLREHRVAEELLNRKLTSYYGKKLNEMENELDRMGIGGNYYNYKLLLETGRMSYHFSEDKHSMLAEHIMRMGEYAILDFMRNISDVISSLKTSHSTYNKSFEQNMPLEFIKNLHLENIVEYSRKHDNKYSDILEMYYRSIMKSMEPDRTDHFYRLKDLFFNNYHKFTREESYMWTSELTNYCITMINKGEKEFRKTTFEIDMFKLREGLVYEGKFIPKFLFIQIYINAMVSDEMEWAKDFIEKYGPKLKHSYQKPVTALAYATYYFKLKDYNKVMEYLNSVTFIDGLDKLYVRFYYIRIYYELEETELLYSYIDATRHFLSNLKTVGDFLVDRYVRFLSCFVKLISIRETKDAFEIKKMRDTIANDKAMALWEWLIEKLDEIESNKKSI